MADMAERGIAVRLVLRPDRRMLFSGRQCHLRDEGWQKDKFRKRRLCDIPERTILRLGYKGSGEEAL